MCAVQVCVLNYCHDKASKAELDAAKQEVGAVIKRNGGRQVVAPRPQVSTAAGLLSTWCNLPLCLDVQPINLLLLSCSIRQPSCNWHSV